MSRLDKGKTIGSFCWLCLTFSLLLLFRCAISPLPIQTSPLTVTPDRVTTRLQWHFLGPQKESFYTKKCWLEWHHAYSDTFPLCRGCHCKRGSLYCDTKSILHNFWYVVKLHNEQGIRLIFWLHERHFLFIFCCCLGCLAGLGATETGNDLSHPKFECKSLTMRLIFSCAIISYWHWI